MTSRSISRSATLIALFRSTNSRGSRKTVAPLDRYVVDDAGDTPLHVGLDRNDIAALPLCKVAFLENLRVSTRTQNVLESIANLLFEIVRVMSEPAQFRRCRITDGSVRFDGGVQRCLMPRNSGPDTSAARRCRNQRRRIRRVPSEIALNLVPHGQNEGLIAQVVGLEYCTFAGPSSPPLRHRERPTSASDRDCPGALPFPRCPAARRRASARSAAKAHGPHACRAARRTRMGRKQREQLVPFQHLRSFDRTTGYPST